MKVLTLVLLLLFPVFAFSQDSHLKMAAEVEQLIDSATAFARLRQYDQALFVLDSAKQLAQAVADENSVSYAHVCFYEGKIHYSKSDYAQAEIRFLEARQLLERLGLGDPGVYIETLSYLGEIYAKSGVLHKSEALYLQCKSLTEEYLGKDNVQYSNALNNLARLYMKQAKYKLAEPLLLESLALKKGKDENYCGGLVNLGILYRSMGWYHKAELLYLEVMDIFKNGIGNTEHAYYISTVGNLANLYFVTKEYSKAEPLFFEALELREQVFGAKSFEHMVSMLNLGSFYTELGNYEKSVVYYSRALTYCQELFGKDSYYYAYTLSNLATLYLEREDYQQAETLYQETLLRLGASVGKKHDSYAQSLHGLATVYKMLERFEESKLLYEQALGIQEEVVGRRHAEYGNILGGLADLYAQMGKYEAAELMHLEALSILNSSLGKQEERYAENLSGLAHLYWRKGNDQKAVLYFTALARLNRSLIADAHYYLSEKELDGYLKSFTEQQGELMSFAHTRINKEDRELLGAIYDNCLFYKGFLLNGTQQIKRLAHENTETETLFHQLKVAKLSLLSEFSKPTEEQDKELIAELQEKADWHEKTLARAVSGFGEARRQASWQEVQSELEEEAVAIEFVRYTLAASKEAGAVDSDRVVYAAMVLQSRGNPLLLPLASEEVIQKLLKRQSPNPIEYINTVYTVAANEQEPSLYELLWQPLEQILAEAKTIYFSPAGVLHRINLGAIQMEDGSCLSDHYNFVLLGSTRNVGSFRSSTPKAESTAQLFGGINYNLADTRSAYRGDMALDAGPIVNEMGKPESQQNLSRNRLGEPSSIKADWSYLPWTEVEVETIDLLMQDAGLKTVVKMGSRATEAAFKAFGEQAPSPNILHLATHGYFSPGQMDAIFPTQEAQFKMADDPMMRAGLILAGGNDAWQSQGQQLLGIEDGILTAYEISQTNLSNTDLVVLSACETALGEVEDNEEVYGLQRAFKIAGATYIIMSLWQVPDFYTQELMTNFYFNWLSLEMAIPDAFRGAQAAIREKNPMPFYWAGFVLVE